ILPRPNQQSGTKRLAPDHQNICRNTARAATHERHHLDPIAIADGRLWPGLAWDDLLVALHRDMAKVHAHLLQQRRDRQAGRNAARLSVDGDSYFAHGVVNNTWTLDHALPFLF